MSFDARDRRHFFKCAAFMVSVLTCIMIAVAIVLNNMLTASGGAALLVGVCAVPLSVFIALFMTELVPWARLVPMVVTLGILAAICLFAGPLTRPDDAAAALASQQAAEQYMTDVARIDGCQIVEPLSTFTPSLEVVNDQCVARYDAVHNETVVAPAAGGLTLADVSNTYSSNQREHIVRFPMVQGGTVYIAVYNRDHVSHKTTLPEYLQWQHATVSTASSTWYILAA